MGHHNLNYNKPLPLCRLPRNSVAAGHLPGNGEAAHPNAVHTSTLAGRTDEFTSACTVCSQTITVLVNAWRSGFSKAI